MIRDMALSKFILWAYSSPSVDGMIFAGFHGQAVLQRRDDVKCYEYKLELCNRKPRDDARRTHIFYSPDCPKAIELAKRIKQEIEQQKHEEFVRDRPFKCRQCPERFFLNTHLNTHIAAHHAKKAVEKVSCRTRYRCYCISTRSSSPPTTASPSPHLPAVSPVATSKPVEISFLTPIPQHHRNLRNPIPKSPKNLCLLLSYQKTQRRRLQNRQLYQHLH